MYEAFECNNCFTFETYRLLAFTKVRTNPSATPHCVYSPVASVSHVLVGTQLPFSLVLVFWFRTRVGDTPTAPKKVTFWNISLFYNEVVEQNLAVKSQFPHRLLLKSTNSKAWYEGKTKFDLEVCFGKLLFVHFVFKRINLVRWISFSLILWKPAPQLSENSNTCCCTEMQERGQTLPCQDKCLLTPGVITFMSCRPFSDAKTSLLCFQVTFLTKKLQSKFSNIVMWCLFMLCRFFWEELLSTRKETR